MKIYYNEFDKDKCAALSQLMKDGLIAKGDIDDRSIREVQPGDVAGYDRCHFFAGIGLWEVALRLSGFNSETRQSKEKANHRPIWTGSCPCQPYSTAGRQRAQEDDRHLWPEWFRLIKECRPSKVFGEQVAAAITYGWLDDVYQGLEAEGYAVGSVLLPASAVGAPHRRERVWFVGDAQHDGQYEATLCGGDAPTDDRGQEGENLSVQPAGAGGAVPVAYSVDAGLQGSAAESGREPGRYASPWDTGVWIESPDGLWRLVEPGIPLLANGFEQRVGVIHCAGDAIVPQVAAEFIRAFFDSLPAKDLVLGGKNES